MEADKITVTNMLQFAGEILAFGYTAIERLGHVCVAKFSSVSLYSAWHETFSYCRCPGHPTLLSLNRFSHSIYE